MPVGLLLGLLCFVFLAAAQAGHGTNEAGTRGGPFLSLPFPEGFEGSHNVETCAPNPKCSLGLIETIPENLTYPAGSPSHGSTFDAWTKLLSLATKTVDIASFYWSLQGTVKEHDTTDWEGEAVFKELTNMKSRGVNVRIVQNLPSKEFPDMDTKELMDMGAAEVRNISFDKLIGKGIIHTKLWVIDGKHFYVGSANMDWRSLTQVKEMGVMATDCECLAADAERLFEVYWYLARPGASIPSPWPSSYSAFFNMSNPASITINNTAALAYWASSPPEFCTDDRTGDIDALLNVIYSAQKFVFIAVMDYLPAIIYQYPQTYWGRIDEALRWVAYSRGVHVRLMGSYWSHTEKDMAPFLRSLAADNGTGSFRGVIETRFFIVPKLPTKDIPFTRVNHNKYMVTDNAAYIGTSNWSGDYFISTGGVSLVINQTLSSPASSTVQWQLLQVFERDWNSPYATNVSNLAQG